MSPETIFAIITGASSVGFGVYAALSKESLKAAKDAAQEWKDKNTASREEIHALRADLNAQLLTMRDQWEDDKIELAKLRQQTNFDPVNQRLTSHIESQGKFNEALVNRLDKMADTHDRQFESQKMQNDAIIQIMERLVPIVSDEERHNQDEPI